jgi:hypothetical protein
MFSERKVQWSLYRFFKNIKYWLDLTGKGELAGIASLIPGFLESTHWIFRRVYKIGYDKKKLLFS